MNQEVKLVVVGTGGVGKSALVIQYVENSFVANYDPTIEDYYRKQDMIGGDTAILEILDYCGAQEHNCMRDLYFRQGKGFLICISLTNRNSMQDAQDLIEQIVQCKDVNEYESVPMILVGTRSDLQNERQVTPGDIQALTSKYHMPYMETSAKTNSNVKEVFHTIAARVLESQLKEVTKKNSNGKKHGVCSVQ